NSCITNCGERTDPEVAACLANTTDCGALDACMPRPDSSFCGQACRRFAACSDNPEETLAQCTCNDHSGGAMRCVAEAAGCGDIEACLRDAPKEAGCRGAFDKMISCEYAEEAERAQWTRGCVESIASQRYDCIEEAPCDVLVARCFPLVPFPDCGEVCRRYKRCAVIDEAAVAGCTTTCTNDEWSTTALACLVRTTCDEIVGACEVQP
ncbi:MAG: hypothetical protein OSB21_14685, partial [Myxococcota bacterium]|nr:hypothetical protein [Myxococcota bacterium]